MEKAIVAGTVPIKVSMEKGKKYAWCSCGLSEKQPFCDGKHRGTAFKPTVFEATETKDVHFCNCKQTGRQMGLCDGAHKTL